MELQTQRDVEDYLEHRFAALPGITGDHLAGHLAAIGRVETLLFRPDADSKVSVPTDQLHLTLDGVTGDCHAGRTSHISGRDDLERYLLGHPKRSEHAVKANLRQLTLVTLSDSAYIAAIMGLPDALVPEGLQGENIIADIDAGRIPVGGALMFISPVGEFRNVRLFVSNVNNPCGIPGSNIGSHYGSGFRPAVQYKIAAGNGRRGYTLMVRTVARQGASVFPGDFIAVFNQGV
jgi:hypothetical protein